jgi:mRNA interferase RelE/StbE
MKRVVFRAAAERAFRKLPREAQKRLSLALERYAGTGDGDVRKLVNVEGARLRAGDYRAIFVEGDTTIEVMAVGHRKHIYG